MAERGAISQPDVIVFGALYIQRGHIIVQLHRRGRRGRIVQKGETKFGARTMTYQIADSLRRLGLTLASVSLASAWKLVQSVKDQRGRDEGLGGV